MHEKFPDCFGAARGGRRSLARDGEKIFACNLARARGRHSADFALDSGTIKMAHKVQGPQKKAVPFR